MTRRGLKSLIRRKFLTESFADEADSAEAPEALATRLIENGSLSEVQYAAALAEEAQTDVVFADPEGIDRDVLADYSPELLRRHRAVPLCRDDDEVVVAFDQVPDGSVLAELEAHTGHRVRPVMTTRSRVFQILYPEGAPPPSVGVVLSVDGPPDWLRVLLVRAWKQGASALRIDALQDELVVRQLLEGGWQLVEKLPCARLKELVEAQNRFPGFPLAIDDSDPVLCLLEQTSGDPRGPSFRIALRSWGLEPALSDFQLDATLKTAVQCSLAQETGLLLCSAPEESLAARLSCALARIGGMGRILGLVEAGPWTWPSSARRLPDLEAAARAADVVVSLRTELRDLPAAVEVASRRLVIVALSEPQAACAVLAMLEAGCRPSLVAANLIVVLQADSTPPHALEILRLGNDERAAIAADDRTQLARLLWTA